MIIKTHRNNNLYYFAFIIWFVTDCLAATTIKYIAGISLRQVNNIVNVLVLLLLLVKIIFYQQYSHRQMILIILLTIPVVISAIMSTSLNVLCLLIFIVAAKDLDTRRLVKDVYYALIVLIIFICTLCLMGIIGDYVTYREGSMRHSLGFSHPNGLGMRVVQFVICFLILHDGKMLLQISVIFISCVFVYLVPNSQTAYILLLVLLAFLPVYYRVSSKKGVDRFASVLILGTVFLTGFSFMLTFIDVSRYQLLKVINRFLSFRFTYAHRAFMESGIKVFGQVVYISEEERRTVGLQGHLYLDNAYATLLIRYGVAVTIIFLTMYICTMQRQKMQGNLLMVLIYFIYSLYGLMEPSMFKVNYNIVLLYIAELLYCDEHKESETLMGS